MPDVLVASTRFGELQIADEELLELPSGLLGFEAFRRFALLDHDGSGTYYWLQSTDEPDLAFLAVVPWPFFPDYEPEIDDEVEHALELTDAADAQVLCLVTIRAADDDPEATVISANLLGPVVVNLRTRVGAQVVLHDAQWPVRAELVGA